jgi:hypothetical protein
MKKSTSALFALAVGLGVVGLIMNRPLFAGTGGSPDGITGNGAAVVTGACFFDNGGGSLWEGTGTWIKTPSGRINGSCHATLVSGPGVTALTQVAFLGGTPFGPESYTGVLTPSGEAELFTHN